MYNRSRVPKYLAVDQLPNASYGPDTGFGNRVRFADPAGAAVKYGLVPVAPDILGPPTKSTDDVSTIATPSFSPAISTCQTFDKIPRAATQGFDLNVLQVTGTSTKAMIRWQDRTITEVESIELYPYLNVDEHDVWPGEKISFKPDEEQLSESSPSAVRVHKAGVVQSVDAVGRIANVRWYEGAQIDIAANDDATRWQFSGLWHGKLGAETSKVPLYDITAYSAMNMTRGDGAIIMPKPQLLANQGMRASGLLSASLGRAIGLLGIPSYQSRSNTHSTELYSPSRPSTAYDSSEIDSENIDWCGEILDLCLDGEVIVRLGAAAEVRDIKVPPERILVVGLEDVDDGSEDDDDDESNLSDQMSVDDMNTDHDTDIESPEVLSVSVEYDGEMPVDADNDDSMWTTDEEIESADMYVTSEPEASDPAIEPTLGNRAATIESNLSQKRGCSSTDRHVAFSRYPSMPSQLEVLAGTPTDHHFHNSPCRLTGPVIRRIMRENEIMQRSLPDGVFVRAWDSRLDLLRVLIVGPHDTPYEFAPFVVDLQFGPNFPTSPPDIFFHSWTGNLGRINPNLYEDGKICLSLLGTWDADDKNEAWSPKDSTILQIIVSLMGLVLVKEPYYSTFSPSPSPPQVD